ncbi:hypothetical protein BO85DRAFT_444717 [Aspergillus piperis CBS 112811]|uniref:Uncharacterized protein n=1 Tax=Aspergillus piperis CBS 112811 TaxID=1448313 RepID=A0A8G1RDW3_9EURO|nr:hypothetical protein BO85DRAFT_444717 [Aspergillus piperis CBS 112811]RAH63436.1 hypothetical protein BO85DRAFT_444717 [Aspergillus piperis CBS 112811]
MASLSLSLSLLLFTASTSVPLYVSRQALVFCFLLSVPFTISHAIIYLVHQGAMVLGIALD